MNFVKIDKNFVKTGDFKCPRCREEYQEEGGDCDYMHCANEDDKDIFKCLKCGCKMTVERKMILKYKVNLENRK